MSIIEVKNLHKSYGDVQAVRGVDLEVVKGEIFGILGPNGAGKTTTLEIVEGLQKPDKGDVFIDGINAVVNPEEIKKIIGIQLQSESFFDHLSLVELLDLFASTYNQKIDAYQLLKKVDLSEKANSYYTQLSGGQKRRFSIAVSLVNNPKVLFLDEPTTGLDPQARRYAWELIKDIKNKGVTVVLTTHYMEEAEYLCDRIAIMDKGKIVAVGTIEELISVLSVKNYISFSTNKFVAQADLDRLYGVEKTFRENGIYHIETSKPEATLLRLLQESYDEDLNLHNLNLRRPTLEDVFLHLTGHSLRE